VSFHAHFLHTAKASDFNFQAKQKCIQSRTNQEGIREPNYKRQALTQLNYGHLYIFQTLDLTKLGTQARLYNGHSRHLFSPTLPTVPYFTASEGLRRCSLGIKISA
jgi:hypothetical protein